MEKAYKLLAKQENISNSAAKELIDRGLVSTKGRKILIARGEISDDTIFKINEIPKTKILFQDDNILVVDKPPFVTSEEVALGLKDAILLNRLDKETSGVMLFAKNEDFQKKAIEEFKQNRVYKEYVAVVNGKFVDDVVIDSPILTQKGKTAKSKIDKKNGKPAVTKVFPIAIEGNKSKVKIIIENGRTHQIRVHLASIGFPIIGDLLYGQASTKVDRIMLHSLKTEIFDYSFTSVAPKQFSAFGL
jgi:23S rRNA pseudouridine1911/1915/1917 synthase